MRVFRRSKFQRHIVVPLMLVCFMAACHKWVPVASPLEWTLADHHGKVRLTLETGHRIEVDAVYVARDSVFWRAHDDMGLGATRSGFSVPLSDVAKAEVRKTDVVGTVGLVVGVSFAALLAAGVYVAIACEPSPFGPVCPSDR